jgi:hypothetical protein
VFRCGSPGHSRAGRGFPIRTSWDHGPVIDSPRLFADSHVLLRLLMPRHPPCALKNLTTKIKSAFSREPRTQRSRFTKIASFIRCSRPLCSSQTTTPSRPPPGTRPAAQTPRKQTPDQDMQEKPKQPNTGPQKDRPCCLKTQQCAKQQPPQPAGALSPHPLFAKKRSTVLTHNRPQQGRLSADIPPSSTRRTTNASATGSPADPRHRHTDRHAKHPRRSLERR